MEFVLVNVLPILGVGGLIAGVVLRRIDRMERRLERREEARKTESVLVIAGIKACGHLAEEAAHSIKRGSHNGKLDDALTYHKDFKDDLNAFLLKQNAERNYG